MKSTCTFSNNTHVPGNKINLFINIEDRMTTNEYFGDLKISIFLITTKNSFGAKKNYAIAVLGQKIKKVSKTKFN